jgi:hypothetical protein
MVNISKFKRRIWARVVAFARTKTWYYKIYSAYWHFSFFSKNQLSEHLNYYTAMPNPGAGIGHQMANWIAGHWFARMFGLQFAHTPFSSKKWEQFLGFGIKEKGVEDLLSDGYKKVHLPLFDEYNPEEVALTRDIISSYRSQRVVFLAEQDQFYKDQFGLIAELRAKFHNAPARRNDISIYSKAEFNIAIHVRRGDIVVGQVNQNPNLLLRWQDNSYFERVLTTVVNHINPQKRVAIYLFSQGVRSEFPEFEQYENIHFCLEMNSQDSFLHMVNADMLITSKSSFSYKPALLSNGIKISPKNFWHGYPAIQDWILVDDNGQFDTKQLEAEC